MWSGKIGPISGRQLANVALWGLIAVLLIALFMIFQPPAPRP